LLDMNTHEPRNGPALLTRILRPARRAAVAGAVAAAAAAAAFGAGVADAPYRAEWKHPDGKVAYFGFATAIDGDVAAVGTPSDSSQVFLGGGAIVYRRNAGVWEREAFLAPQGLYSFEQMPTALAVSGDTLVMTSVLHQSVPTLYDGSAWVFVRSPDGTWTEQALLTGQEVGNGDFFGISAAIDGDTIVIGAWLDDNDQGDDAGGAYVFTRSDGVWTQQAKLQPTDLRSQSRFGSSVAIHGDLIAVGANDATDEAGVPTGAVYVYRRTDGAWNQEAKLLAPDGEQSDGLGSAVAVEGDTVVGCAYVDDLPGRPDVGSAYVWVKKGATWRLQAHIEPPETFPNPEGSTPLKFGICCALRNGILAIGTNGEDLEGATDTGSVCTYVREGQRWFLRGRLYDADRQGGERLGHNLGLSDDTLITGAPGDSEPAGSVTVVSNVALYVARVEVAGLAFALKYAEGAADRLTLRGVVPPVGVPDSIEGRSVTVTVGSLARTVTLDAKGRGTSDDTVVTVKRGKPGKPATITLTVKGDFSAALAPLGMDGSADAKKLRVPIGGSIDLGAGPVTIEGAVLFNATAGAGGSARLTRR
jgi:hypothetical protein